MEGAVFEGGTFRTVFSCGVMDALLDYGVEFPYVSGVSAGITYGASYVSKQRGRNIEIILRFRRDKRYLGVGNLKSDKSLFGLKFVYDKMANEIIPFDRKTFLESPVKVVVGVTNCETGKPEYLDGKKMNENCDMLKATCAIPFVFPPIEINNNKYYDGGVSDPIPVRKAQFDGCDKLLLVLTRPKSYTKTLGRQNIAAAKILKNKYPELSRVLMNRHITYNDTVRYCNQLERQGKAVILRPDDEHKLNSFESNLKVLASSYSYGYNMAVSRMDDIKALFH